MRASENQIVELKEKIDFFVQTQTPPLRGVFYNGQLWDARALVLSLVSRAKRSLILIDNWANTAVLDLFTRKREGVNECCQCENVASGQFQFPIEDAA